MILFLLSLYQNLINYLVGQTFPWKLKKKNKKKKGVSEGKGSGERVRRVLKYHRACIFVRISLSLSLSLSVFALHAHASSSLLPKPKITSPPFHLSVHRNLSPILWSNCLSDHCSITESKKKKKNSNSNPKRSSAQFFFVNNRKIWMKLVSVTVGYGDSKLRSMLFFASWYCRSCWLILLRFLLPASI